MHIRGNGAVHTGGAEFEVRKQRKVDLVFKIKVVKFECTTEHSTLREKIPLQNFTSQVNLIKGVWNIKVTFVLTLLSVKMQI